MPRVSPVQNNFTAGEISPRLLGREDVARYTAAVARMENYRVMPHGGATRKPGSVFVAECIDSTKKSRLLDFEQSVEQAYVLEFGDLAMHVFKDNGQVLSGPSTPYEIATPFLEADLFALQYAQNADVMYIANEHYWPRKLTRTGHTSWTLINAPMVDGPYLKENTTSRTMTPSAATGAITIAASTAYFVASMAPVGTEPGALIRLKVGANPYGYARITGFVSTTVVNATVLSTFTAAAATTVWAEGAWSTYRGFPRSVTFFEQRLYFGGTSYQPQTLWGSTVDAYENFTPGTADDSAVAYTIASRKMNAIQWLFGKEILFVGTAGTSYTGGDPTAPLTPTNVRITPGPKHGAAYIAPLEVGNVLLFASRSKRKIREITFEYTDNAYRAPDDTLLAEHITLGGVVQMAYADEPDSVVHIVRSDGVMLAFTFDKEQQIVAFARDTTEGLYESVATIPVSKASGTEGYTQRWQIVNRTIGGVTKRYVEYEAPPFEDDVDIEDAFFVDCGLAYDGVATNTLSGLGHLEGKTVAILGDGAVIPSQVVTAGTITLPSSRTVTKAAVGLAYTSTIETLPGIFGSQDGTAQGKAKSWGKIKIRFYRSVCALVNSKEVYWRKGSDPTGAALQPFTGTKEITNLGWDSEARNIIQQDRPLPSTVLAIFGTELVEDM